MTLIFMFLKIVKYIILVVIGVGILYGGFVLGVESYDKFRVWRNEQLMKQIDEDFDRMEQETLERQMADTFGGTTPQETLQMFIKAVEAGDYDLASKYFIEGKRDEWKENLVLTKDANNMIEFLSLIKKAERDLEEFREGVSEADVPIYIRIIVYPNNIWKLTDI